MRRGGTAAVALVLAAGPAAAQSRAGQSPGAGVATTAASLEDYTSMLQAADARLRAALALLVAHGTREPQEGSRPPAHQRLLDEAHTAWVMAQNASADFRGREVYEAADRRFRDSIAVMRVASTPPAAAAAAAEAREFLGGLAMLRNSAAAAAGRSAATAGAWPSADAMPAQGAQPR